MENEELTAIYIRERNRFENLSGDVIIGTVRPEEKEYEVSIKGPAEYGELKQRMCYRFFGRWAEYKNKRTGETEDQFHFTTFVETTPFSKAAIIKYLQIAPGIGKSVASRIWDEHGEKSVEMLRNKPLVCANHIKGLSADIAKKASETLKERYHTEGCMIELMGLLDGRGLPKSTAKTAIQIWGNRAPRKIKRNPYLLMSLGGCGFKRADAMYLDLGLDPARLKRQALCAWNAIASHNDTWVFSGVARSAIANGISGSDTNVRKALRLAIRARLLDAKWTDGAEGKIDWDGDTMWLAESRKAKDEMIVADFVRKRIHVN